MKNTAAMMLAREDVFLYARKLTLGTATLDELGAAFKRYDEAKATVQVEALAREDRAQEGTP